MERCQSCDIAMNKAEAVGLHPCRCSFCKDCWISSLAIVRLQPVLKCPSCKNVVICHRLDRPAIRAEANADDKPAAKLHLVTVEHIYAAAAASQTSSQVEDSEVQHDDAKDDANDTGNKTGSPPKKRKRASSATPKVKQTTAQIVVKRNNTNHIDQLIAYREQHGNCNVPLIYVENLKLGRWVEQVRRRRRQLTDEQNAHLVELGFVWAAKRPTFNERIGMLKEYKEKYGNCHVPRRHEMGEWVKSVRSGSTKLTAEKRKLLNAVGFCWETQSNRNERHWNERLARLEAYKQKYGDCKVPWEWAEDKQLSGWCHTQRKREVKGKLRPDRKEALDKIGFHWSEPITARGDQSVEQQSDEEEEEEEAADTSEAWL